eukprot:GILK01002762.1.p1 GENE.GILK01002762.1~~GILK01002762.1.p1  ORF type:complete len:265 (+),score=37.61 GILK01002762.1:255-1049(+)
MAESRGSVDYEPNSKGELNVRWCHHCRAKKSTIRCSNTDTPGVLGQPKTCRKAYCRSCLSRYYNEEVAEDNPKAWKCPFCRNKCCCSYCTRQQDALARAQIDDIKGSFFPPQSDRVLFETLSNLQSTLLQLTQEVRFRYGNFSIHSPIALSLNAAQVSLHTVTSLMQVNDDIQRVTAAANNSNNSNSSSSARKFVSSTGGDLYPVPPLSSTSRISNHLPVASSLAPPSLSASSSSSSAPASSLFSMLLPERSPLSIANLIHHDA